MKNYVVPALGALTILAFSCKKESNVEQTTSAETSAVVAAASNSLVAESAWQSSGTWTEAENTASGVFEVNLTPVQLEQNGVLRVFLSHSGDADAIALPATVEGYEYYYVAANNKVSIYARPVSDIAGSNPPAWQVKNVFVNSSAVDAAEKKNISLENLMNYSLNELTDLTFEEPITTVVSK